MTKLGKDLHPGDMILMHFGPAEIRKIRSVTEGTLRVDFFHHPIPLQVHLDQEIDVMTEEELGLYYKKEREWRNYARGKGIPGNPVPPKD